MYCQSPVSDIPLTRAEDKHLAACGEDSSSISATSLEKNQGEAQAIKLRLRL